MISMKHLLLPLLVVSTSCAADDSATQPVYDTENHELTSLKLYYVLPSENGTAGGGGGLGMIHTHRRCNFFAAQAHDEGIPVHFLSYSGDKIMTSTIVKIGFHIITTCVQAMYWHVGGGGGGGGSPHQRVIVGKNEGSAYPAPLPPPFAFHIERHEDGGAAKGTSWCPVVARGSAEI
ncbi:hypothetical protein U9M48_037371 [Paspalum notatum var. saurae]|uniref:Uncharacterized protein n=1 Tax=Paspalum notatum var. saurae TaxID=547442 RepID=A0AAQ3XAZ9_PASNO